MWVLLALVGAVIYAISHELIERRLRIQEKRANCHHYRTEITDTYGHKTKHCLECGHQEPVKETKHD